MKSSTSAGFSPPVPISPRLVAADTPALADSIGVRSTVENKHDRNAIGDEENEPKRFRHDSLPASGSRRQRDARLESWREVTRQAAYLARILKWKNEEAPGENRHSAIERINAWLCEPEQELDLSGLNLTSLPELPNGIGQLNASCNRIGSLGHLPETLFELDLDQNLLTSVPLLPAGMTNFYASENRIMTIEEPLPADLEWLAVSANMISSLPPLPAGVRYLHAAENKLAELQDLPRNLCELYIDSNHLTDLPDSIASLLIGCEIDLLDNDFLPGVATRIETLAASIRRDDPTRGPTFNFPTESDEGSAILPIEKQVASWFRERAMVPSPAQTDVWEKFRVTSPDESHALSIQLGRLRETAHYEHRRHDLVSRVIEALRYLTDHGDARLTCAAIAVDGTMTCDDRIALAFIEIEETIINHRAAHGAWTRQRMIAAGTGMFRSSLLKEVANKKANAIQAASGEVDRSEIVLRYWTALSPASQLNLPAKIEFMAFANVARDVTASDIREAKLAIDAATRSPQRHAFLGNWHPWTVFVEKQYPTQYASAQKLIDLRKSRLFGDLEAAMSNLENPEHAADSETSATRLDLIHQIGQINAEYGAVGTTVLTDLTRRIVDGEFDRETSGNRAG